MRCIPIVFGFLLWGGVALSVQADVVPVNNDALKKLIQEGVPLIDVRRKDEWLATGVVEGSHLLTFFDAAGRYDVEQWLHELEQIVSPGQPFMLICEVGGRTGSITSFLDKKLQLPGVHDVSAGIRGWIKAGEPVVPYAESPPPEQQNVDDNSQ